MIPVNSTGYFITGSDTDVGKTYITCNLIRQLRQSGIQLEVRKPAESGCTTDSSGNLVALDASKLEAANNFEQSSMRITPYRFEAALAPHRAARLEGKKLFTIDLIRSCTLDDDENLLIVEGAGGFYSPIAEDGLNADLAVRLNLPVIIVVNNKIGAVNQALMTIQAVESRQLVIAAVILNDVANRNAIDMNNNEDLRQHCNYPIFNCAFQDSLEPLFESAVFSEHENSRAGP